MIPFDPRVCVCEFAGINTTPANMHGAAVREMCSLLLFITLEAVEGGLTGLEPLVIIGRIIPQGWPSGAQADSGMATVG